MVFDNYILMSEWDAKGIQVESKWFWDCVDEVYALSPDASIDDAFVHVLSLWDGVLECEELHKQYDGMWQFDYDSYHCGDLAPPNEDHALNNRSFQIYHKCDKCGNEWKWEKCAGHCDIDKSPHYDTKCDIDGCGGYIKSIAKLEE